LRAFFGDDHVHMALLVDDGRLVGTVERADLVPELPDELPAWAVASLEDRLTAAGAPLADAFQAMKRASRRRLALVDEDGNLAGLLCLKSSGDGFCSNEDVAGRRRDFDG
jgi:CBS domain-containing protein